jgi:hypothetical protein
MYAMKQARPLRKLGSSASSPLMAEARGPVRHALGTPLNIRQVASLIGCSVWTVRQTLIPKGLPHFRLTALGRLIFYEDQIIRWIERKQSE